MPLPKKIDQTELAKRTTDEFMACLGIVRQWFEDENLEVSDFTLGRFASRLQTFKGYISEDTNETEG